jgi:mono/diheme cytochrome c family protein
MNLSNYFRPSLALLVATLGCSSSSSPDQATDASSPDAHSQQDSAAQDSATAPDSSGGNEASTPVLSFGTDIYTPIIKEHCIFCHGPTADGGLGSGEAFGKLDMSSADAGYANLVNVTSTGVECGNPDSGPTPIRVVPGNAESSLLYLKVNGYTQAPPCGGPMPKSGEIADGGQAVVVEQIQTWINQGAQP